MIPLYSIVTLHRPVKAWLAKGVGEWPAGSRGVLLDTFDDYWCNVEMFEPEPDVLPMPISNLEIAHDDWRKCPLVDSVPGRIGGAWCVKGSRLPVEALLTNYNAGYSVEEVCDIFVGKHDVKTIRQIIQFARPGIDDLVTVRRDDLLVVIDEIIEHGSYSDVVGLAVKRLLTTVIPCCGLIATENPAARARFGMQPDLMPSDRAHVVAGARQLVSVSMQVLERLASHQPATLCAARTATSRPV